MDAKWILLLYMAILHTVTSAPESVFALEGNSVTLTLHKRVNLDPDDAVWIFNQTRDVVRYYPHHPKSRQLRVLGLYKGRVEFDSTTFSLELKNLQKTDSGLYRGEINAEGRKTVVEYKLSVYEQVSAPILTVGPVLSSGDLCNMTVTCTAGDLSLTSTCNSSICIQAELTGSSSLAILIRDGDIICNHSNPVSLSQATVDFERACPQAQHFFDKQNATINTAVGGLVPVAFVICAVLLICVLHKRCTGANMAKRKIIPIEMFPMTNGDKEQSEVVCGKASPAFPQIQTPGSELKQRKLNKPSATPSVKSQSLGSAVRDQSPSESWARQRILSSGSRKDQSPSQNKPSFTVENLSQGSEPKKQNLSTPRAKKTLDFNQVKSPTSIY
ncbi:SLAM family member 6-like [Alosa pseudoharengus]|uniref:SLAM family member 6-like n=1 Tax=Alosa pseudoharengus TaxID=34774 RepID=UPI003F89DC1B